MKRNDEALKEAIKNSSFKQREICKMSGLKPAHLNGFLKGRTGLSADNYNALRNVLVKIGEMEPLEISMDNLVEMGFVLCDSENSAQIDQFATCGTISADKGEVVMEQNSSSGKPLRIAKEDIDPEWDKKKLMAFRVEGNHSDRYRDGTQVLIERDVPLESIKDGDDVIVYQAYGKKAYLRRWRISSEENTPFFQNLKDPSGVSPFNQWNKIFGVVRLVHA